MTDSASERCGYSWLLKRECAHCLGHTLPEEYEAVAL